MTIEQQVCSLELAKRLKELGVHSDALWAWIDIDKPYLVYRPSTGDNVGISAFTAAELGEMLPWFVEKGADRYEMNMMKNGTETPFSLFYDEYHSSKLLGDCLVVGATEADARAKMLIHLIEQGVIDPKNV